MKNFILAALLLTSAPAYAEHKPDHMCMAVSDFEKEFAEKNPDYKFQVKKYNKTAALNFIAFSFMEFNIQPPDENPDKITGLYYLSVESHERGFVAIMNGEKICSNTMINKRVFELLMESLEGKRIET